VLPGVEPPPANPQTPKRPARNAAPPTTVSKFKITIAEDVPAGMHDVRLIGKWGVSNPRAFLVGHGTEVQEKEPNDDVPQAQRVELNSTVNGVINTPTDVDYYVFVGKKGQRVVFSCLASSIDSKLEASLEIYDTRGRQLAFNRGYQDGDALTDCILPADGDYYVRLCQFTHITGGPDHFYRLSITTAPWIDAVFPAVVPPGQVTLVTVYGRNLPSGTLDSDVRVDGHALEKLVMTVQAPDPPDALGRLGFTGRIDPITANLDGFELRVRNEAGESNPFLLTYARAPLLVDNGTNHTSETAQEITLPCEIAGWIAHVHNRDWYVFTAKKGEAYNIELFSQRLGAPADMKFVVRNAANNQTIFEAQDNNEQLSPKFFTRNADPAVYRFTAPADGKYQIQVKSLTGDVLAGPRQFYRLRIMRDQPDFRLVVMPPDDSRPDAVRLPVGGSQFYTVFAWRSDGWNGDIALNVDGLPAGVSCPSQVLAAGLRQVPLVLTADPDAEPWTGPITIKGTAIINGQKVEREARYASVTWAVPPQQNIPTTSRLDRSLVLAVRDAGPYEVVTSIDNAVIRQGDKAKLTVKLYRSWADAKVAVALRALDLLPTVIAVNNNQPFNLAPDKGEGTLTVDVKTNTAPGTYNLVLAGVAQVPFNKDPMAKQKQPINVVLPSTPIAVTVVPRSLASITLTPANPMLKAGTETELVVKVSRQNGYAGEYKVQLILPETAKGLSAEDVVIAAGANETKLVLQADEDAEPGARANVLVRLTGLYNGTVPITQESKLTVNVVK
jgi:hypothetical protein